MDAKICKKLKEMTSDESKASREYRKLRKELESDVHAWNIIDDIYQDETHHHSQLVILTKKLCG